MNSELGKRIAFTLGALLIYRIGCFIPLPGINLSVWSQFFSTNADGILGLLNASSGGAAQRLAIFALGILPYVSAAILIQLVLIVFGRMKVLRAQGERGRQTIVAYTRYLTAATALFQSYGIAVALEGIPNLVPNPGLLFRVMAVVTLVGGTLFLVWLSEQMTLRGIGNGIALLLCVGFVTQVPSAIAGALELNRQGGLSSGLLLSILGLVIVATVLAVAMEAARRRVQVDFATPRPDGRAAPASFMSLKLNNGGLIPALGASWLMLLPMMLAGFVDRETPGLMSSIARGLDYGQPLFLVCYALAIVLCGLIYTAMILDPSQMAESLQRHGGTIQGVQPGEETAAYVDKVLSITTFVGAAYLALVCLIPEILVAYAHVPFYFGGASLLIVVCTVLDIGAFFQGGAYGRLGGFRQ